MQILGTAIHTGACIELLNVRGQDNNPINSLINFKPYTVTQDKNPCFTLSELFCLDIILSADFTIAILK